ncbi:hypothetical protein MRX96_028119 [Rhipicephalus microplus]
MIDVFRKTAWQTRQSAGFRWESEANRLRFGGCAAKRAVTRTTKSNHVPRFCPVGISSTRGSPSSLPILGCATNDTAPLR